MPETPPTIGMLLTQRGGMAAPGPDGRLRDGRTFSWDAPVWFCEPWPHPFGLAGLEGFLHHFVVTIRAYDRYLDIEPHT